MNSHYWVYNLSIQIDRTWSERFPMKMELGGNHLDIRDKTLWLWLWQRSRRDFTSNQRRESSLRWDWGGVNERGTWVALRSGVSTFFPCYIDVSVIFFLNGCLFLLVRATRRSLLAMWRLRVFWTLHVQPSPVKSFIFVCRDQCGPGSGAALCLVSYYIPS